MAARDDGRLPTHSISIFSRVPPVEGLSLYKNDEPRVGYYTRPHVDARETQMHFRGALSAAAISPRYDTLSLNFHILASGWTRQHHLTSDGTDISISGDA